MASKEKGKMVVISAPSGAGKSTVCNRLREIDSEVAVSISYTTRAPRGEEKDGVAYHFVDEEEFDRMVGEGAFLEWAVVHGKRYGSSRADTEKLLAQGKDVLFDIDVQGGQQIKRAAPEALLVFLLPPSITELVRRLKSRGTETDKQMERRLANAIEELRQGKDYDFHVMNDVLDEAVRQVDRIRKGLAPAPARQESKLESLVVEASKR